MSYMLAIIFIISIISILSAIAFLTYLRKLSRGNEKIEKISKAIQGGAKIYLRRQFYSVSFVFFLIFLFLVIKSHFIDVPVRGYISYINPIIFLFGGFFSALAGFLGMYSATEANGRTAWAAQENGLAKAFNIAFKSGSVMGLFVVGISLLNVSFWYWILSTYFESAQAKSSQDIIMNILFSYGLGASFMALFARIGGGIYTKAADVGADLVGKVEKGIPEDDPRNPATIADNVGDNVGDVAGMGADLYESYVGSMLATMTIATSAFLYYKPDLYVQFIIMPMFLSGIGILASLIGIASVRISKQGQETQEGLLLILRRAVYLASFLILLFSSIYLYSLSAFYPEGSAIFKSIFFVLIMGIFLGNLIGYATEYYTSYTYKPVLSLAESAKSGSATVLIQGLALGMKSTFVLVFLIISAILFSFYIMNGFYLPLQGLFGIGIAATGMLSTLGLTLASDAYGPVADNAGGIAEMAGLSSKTRHNTDLLDALGNTTAAVGKGFAIGSAALTALSLLFAYTQTLQKSYDYSVIGDFSILNAVNFVALFFGSVLPFFFSSFIIQAVGRAADKMVQEVRRQFQNPDILNGKIEPDHNSCIDISTKSALKEMLIPSCIAIAAPVFVGILLGPISIVFMLAGSITTGSVLAILMSNSGSAWDNAKKYIESGKLGGKNSPEHSAVVTGDTVGDPLKDAAAPAINILIKLIAIVSIVSSSAIVKIRSLFF